MKKPVNKHIAATLHFNTQQLHRNAHHLQRRSAIECKNLMSNFIAYNLSIIMQCINKIIK